MAPSSNDKPKASKAVHPLTPDGRYIVVRGRLWRTANPGLPLSKRQALVHRLMDARRALQSAKTSERGSVREKIERAKRLLGERGPVWWSDGAPDLNRRMARNTVYADWFNSLAPDPGN